MNELALDEEGLGLALDHLLIAVPDLEDTPSKLAEAYKVSLSGGGTHPSHGTANKLVLLNDHYLELLTVKDQDVTRDSWLGMAAARAISAREPLMTWAIRTTDLTAVRSLLETAIGSLPPVEPGGRVTESGDRISWKIQHLYELSLPVPERVPLPFFIEWEDPASHPGAAGRVSASNSRIAEIAIGTVGADARTATAIAILGKLSFVRVEHLLGVGLRSATLETSVGTELIADDGVLRLLDRHDH